MESIKGYWFVPCIIIFHIFKVLFYNCCSYNFNWKWRKQIQNKNVVVQRTKPFCKTNVEWKIKAFFNNEKVLNLIIFTMNKNKTLQKIFIFHSNSLVDKSYIIIKSIRRSRGTIQFVWIIRTVIELITFFLLFNTLAVMASKLIGAITSNWKFKSKYSKFTIIKSLQDKRRLNYFLNDFKSDLTFHK